MINDRPSSLLSRSMQYEGLWIGGLAFSILALNASGRLHFGIQGLLLLAMAFVGVGFVTFYWLSASLQLLARIMGLSPEPIRAWIELMAGLWPLLLLGPATAMQRWLPLPGTFFITAILLATLWTLTQSIHQIYQMSRLKAVLSILATVLLALVALFGILIWPGMFFWGIGNSI